MGEGMLKYTLGSFRGRLTGRIFGTVAAGLVTVGLLQVVSLHA